MKKFTFAFLLLLGVLFVGIYDIVSSNIYDFESMEPGKELFYIALALVYLYLALMLHTIIHEAGHLVCGLKSGYKFTSFRVGSFMLKEEDGKLVWKRFSLAGTGGQCLMSPPDLVDGRMPFVLFNLGGVLFNTIVSVITLILMLVSLDIIELSSFFFIMTLVGIYFAIANGVPLRSGEVDNDGMNVVSLSKDPLAIKALWIQLKINECTSKNISINEMPDEWFELPENANMKNVLISSMAVFKCNKLMAEQKYAEVDNAMKELLNSDAVLAGIYKSLLKLDRAYIEMITENRKEVVDSFIGKMEKNVMVAMKNFPAVVRFQYTYALLVEKDKAKAVEYRAHMEALEKNYPYPVDLKDETELMDYAENIANLI